MISILELVKKNKDNLLQLEFSYDFSKTSTEKIEYNLFGESLIFEIYRDEPKIKAIFENEDNFTQCIRMNIYKKNGDTILKGVPILNYTDILNPLRSHYEFKDIYVTSMAISMIGFRDGVNIKNIGVDNVLVAFKDNGVN